MDLIVSNGRGYVPSVDNKSLLKEIKLVLFLSMHFIHLLNVLVMK